MFDLFIESWIKITMNRCAVSRKTFFYVFKSNVIYTNKTLDISDMLGNRLKYNFLDWKMVKITWFKMILNSVIPLILSDLPHQFNAANVKLFETGPIN